MFENGADVDFGEEFTLNFSQPPKPVNNKRRRLLSPPPRVPKKQKVFATPKNVVKRKFPGPAGILSHQDAEEVPCSQMSVSIFQTSPWLDMTTDHHSSLERYNVHWIKTTATENKLPNHRAPFLAAIIHSIECSEGKNLLVKVVLKDVTGEIHGTITQGLYKQHSESLVPGSGVVLTQCGVLTSNEKHYLTIKPENLVTIYWKNEEDSVIRVQDVRSSDSVKVKVPECDSGPSKSNSEESEDYWESVTQDALKGLDMTFFDDF